MAGYCSIKDTIENPRVLYYNKEKDSFINANEKSQSSGSPILPWLKLFALAYPNYSFCGLRFGSPGAGVADVSPSDGRYDDLHRQISALSSRVRWGGVVASFGFVEQRDYNELLRLPACFLSLLYKIREWTQNDTLPCFYWRYEKFGNKDIPDQYHRYDTTAVRVIDRIPYLDRFTVLVPILYNPAQYYCDSHHYTFEGYLLAAISGLSIFQEKFTPKTRW
jgi:hypothetical protein